MPFWSRNFARTPLLLLGAAETFALFVSVYTAATLLPASVDGFAPVAPRAMTVALVMLVSLIAVGLYQFHRRIDFSEVFTRLIVGLAAGSLVLAIAYYIVPPLTLRPDVAALSLACALVLLLLLRFAFLSVVDESVFRKRILILGAGDRASRISDLRRRADRRGFRIVAQMPALGEAPVEHGEQVVRTDRPLRAMAIDERVDEIVVAMDDRRGNLPIRDLLACKLSGIDVLDVLEFLERETGKIHLDLVNPGWLVFSPGFRITKMRRGLKRIFDVVVSGTALLLLWPVMLAVFLAIKLSDGWQAPTIYRQRRVGYHGKEFSVMKFRSMVVDAEANCGARWATENDPRITKIGAVLRDYRLDELPQIFNVLKGEMSIVGPRPERPEFVKELQERIPYYAERHTVMPGVTGWAQLKYKYGASEDDAFEKLQYDLYYVKNHSLILDLMIILQTTEVVLWRKGAR